MSRYLQIAFLAMIAFGFVFAADGLSSTGGNGGGNTTTTTTATNSMSTSTTTSQKGTSSQTITTTTGTTTATIIKVQPTITLSCSPGITQAGGSTTCTVNLLPVAQSTANPGGMVNFAATGTLSPPSASCVTISSSCSVSFRGAGTVTANYVGDAYDLPTSISFTVEAYQQQQVTVTVGNNNAAAGTLVQLGASGCSGCTYTWSFGDGSTLNSGTYGSVTHIYAAAGSYTVSVSGQGGNLFGSGSAMVTIAPVSSQNGQALLAVEVAQVSTNAGIEGAAVTVNGGQSQTTNAYGQVTYLEPAGAYTVCATFSGFQENCETINLSSPGGSVTVLLQANGCGVAGRTCPQSIIGPLFGSGPVAVGSEIILGIVLIFGGGIGFVLTRKAKPGL